MADANSITGLKSRIQANSRVYLSACPDCGKERWNDKRRVGKPCPPCSAAKRKTHGLCGTPLFKLLMNVRARCEQPSASNYSYYGGRGIKVCDEWVKDPQSFVTWAEANGYAKGLELDRKDVDGPYAPDNCRFITHKENSQTRRNARCDAARAQLVKAALADGKTVKHAAQFADVPYMTAWHISKGRSWRD